MRSLTLFRHAKSGWDDPVARDFDRALNDRGRRGARTMGAWAVREGQRWDHIVSSPAVRCVDTIEAFGEGYGQVLHPVWDRRIYLASDATLMDVVRELPDTAARVLMCGHNPGMEDLTLLLVPDAVGDASRDAVEEKFPTAAMARIDFDGDRWAAIAPQSGRLVAFTRPRDLDAALGPTVE